MIYAYVKAECCRVIEAEMPGACIGREERPVSQHGDYLSWSYGKRETLRLMKHGETWYQRRAALCVAELLGWVEVVR